jgi:signal transduction histidine kinase
MQVQQQGRRLLGMVEDLLEVARAESGRLVPVPEPVAVGPSTTRVLAPLLEAAQRGGLSVHQRCEVEAPCLLDLRLWENIVVNLVTNAVKYTLAGAVDVELVRDGVDLVLTVRDTGIGIAAAEQPLVFQRFHRVRTDRGRTIEGAGVGLAIVADAVHALHGSVDLVSAPDEGTTVTVRLPGVVRDDLGVGVDADPVAVRLASVEARGRALVGVPDGTSESGIDVSLATEGAGTRLLVVDDNPAMRAHVVECLRDLGSVLVAADGLQALEVLQRHRVDLVVSDVMMPRLDGEGLLARIRGNPAWSDLPVVLLSARAETGAAVSGLDRGADDYVAKPFAREELVARVRAHLELARLRRETQRTRDRDSLLAGLSHDMQTPLAVILGGLGLLERAASAPADLDVLRRVRRGGEDLRGLVCELLDTSALSLGHEIRVRPDRVDLAVLVADVLRGGCPEVEVDVEPGCMVLADPLRLRRILTNLLDNAARAGARRVRVEAHRPLEEGACVEVLVVDDGAGMTGEVVARLFEAWESGDPGGPGRGLGLFVSRASARSMGGDLLLRATGPGGSTFALTVPRSAATTTWSGTP